MDRMKDRTMAGSAGRAKRSFIAAAIGTAVVALCCFTAMLVIVLGLVRLGALTPYLDYVLLPALAVLLVVTVVSYRKWRRSYGPSLRAEPFHDAAHAAASPQGQLLFKNDERRLLSALERLLDVGAGYGDLAAVEDGLEELGVN
jgi:mercuric ion transport protein